MFHQPPVAGTVEHAGTLVTTPHVFPAPTSGSKVLYFAGRPTEVGDPAFDRTCGPRMVFKPCPSHAAMPQGFGENTLSLQIKADPSILREGVAVVAVLKRRMADSAPAR